MDYGGPGELIKIMDGPNYGKLWFDKFPIAVVAHTTETKGRPGYNNGAYAPQITIDPARYVVYQHQPLDRRCGALEGTKKVYGKTGTMAVMNEKALQIEIIGYSDKNTVERHGGGRRWVGDFGDDDYEFISAVVHYLKDTFVIGDTIHARPSGKSWTAGASSPHRLGARAWEQLDGFTAHGGVFGQDHWDTGVLDLNRIWKGDDVALTPEQERALALLTDWMGQTEISSWAGPSWEKAKTVGLIRHDETKPGIPPTLERMVTFLDRRGLLEDGRLWTKAQISALVAAAAGAGATASEVIAEVIRRLGG